VVTFARGRPNATAAAQPIRGRPGGAFAAGDFGPVLDWKVRGHDQAIRFFRGCDDVKRQLGSGFAGGDMAEFIEDRPRTVP